MASVIHGGQVLKKIRIEIKEILILTVQTRRDHHTAIKAKNLELIYLYDANGEQ